MGFQVSDLWREPVLNPVNRKARSVPILNPINRHGRVFFFSWMGFMLAFWAWYAFPPLVGFPES
jgi:NNP family nitrate/nitrite transporter-like MFS transporter